jgi:nucleoside-diphosphate-sugar epimerase
MNFLQNPDSKIALIGHTGFVGSTLKKQFRFTHFYNTQNIQDIKGQHFDLCICAAAPAQKWKANQNPNDDLKVISQLIESLKTFTTDHFWLISTVDVFALPVDVNEKTNINLHQKDYHAYGKHRRQLEIFVEDHFLSKHHNGLIARLPGLVGHGLKKNIIYDFHHNNDIHKIDSRHEFQFYPMENLIFDLILSAKNKLSLIHLTSEPITVREVAELGFGRLNFQQEVAQEIIRYNFQTIYAHLWNSDLTIHSNDLHRHYQYQKSHTLQSIRSYHQS